MKTQKTKNKQNKQNNKKEKKKEQNQINVTNQNLSDKYNGTTQIAKMTQIMGAKKSYK